MLGTLPVFPATPANGDSQNAEMARTILKSKAAVRTLLVMARDKIGQP